MKKATKIFAIILAISVVIAAFGACGNNKKTENSSGGKFTYWLSMPAQATETLQSYNDLMMYQEISKATGVEVEFLSPASGTTGTEAFQILMASNPSEYPDIIEYSWKGYPGGPDQAINDGVIISLNDYLVEYAPNYYDYMEGKKGEENNNLYKAQAISTEGNYFGFSALEIPPYRGFSGIAVRKDLLDKWNLDIPVTIDDWENVFKTAQANGFKYPFTDGGKRFTPSSGYNMFNTAWKVGQSFYLDDNTVKFGPFEKEYKDYISTMAEWVKKGYIDPDFVTNDAATFEGYMTNGTSIAAYMFIGSGMGKLLPAMEKKDPSYSLVACPFPVLKEGDTPWFQALGDEVISAYTAAITTTCGAKDENRYKDAIKWCDYLYSEEGMILKSFGVEGDTYTIEEREDGKHYVYTDKILDHEKSGMHSVQAALYHFMRPGSGPGLGEHPDYLDGFYPYEEQKDAIRVWNSNVDEAKKHVLPTLSYTAEESTEMANIKASAQSDLNAAVLNIMMGRASVDSLDAAIKTAKEKGYDRLIEITQAAYDRYRKSL